MKSTLNNENRKSQTGLFVTIGRGAALALYTVSAAYGQSPWEDAVSKLQVSFTGPIAKGLSLVAIVIGGLTFAYSEGGSKKQFASLIFGIGMAVSAASFFSWLFGA